MGYLIRWKKGRNSADLTCILRIPRWSEKECSEADIPVLENKWDVERNHIAGFLEERKSKKNLILNASNDLGLAQE